MNPDLVGQGYADYIGTRTKPGQTQVEYYNKQNNMAFGTPQEVFGYASTLAQKPVGSFADIQAGFTPRAQALDTIKNDLNAYQQQTFDSQQPSNQRKSSSITESINSQQGDLDKYLAEYNELKTKIQGVAAPNYQESFNKIREEQGIPGFEKEYADLGQERRELPYVERANTGNAAIATEGQLQAQTNEKDIPLYIKQSNALDRLKIAQSFVESSLKLKELDHNASRQALLDAIDVVGNVINFGRDNLKDLYARSKDQQELEERAKGFAFENRITAPFYDIGGTVYRSSDGKAASSPEEYIAMGGSGDFKDVQKISGESKEDKEFVSDLRSKYPDARISSDDSADVAIGKLSQSRIYQEQVRPPARAGGGSSTNTNSLVQAVLSNPALYGTLTPTQRATILPGLVALGLDPGSLTDKPLSDTAIANISQFQSAISNLNELRNIVYANQDYLGPIKGLQKLNPYSPAKKAQADVDRVRQQVGKALEGGVLRKEDEEKYKQILATLTDTPSTAVYKIDALLGDMKRQLSTFTSAQQAAGRNVSGFVGPTNPESLRAKYNY